MTDAARPPADPAAMAAAFIARSAREDAARRGRASRIVAACLAAGLPDQAEAVLAALPTALRPEQFLKRIPAPEGGATLTEELTRRAALSAAMRRAGLGPLPEWVVNDKLTGHDFVARLGLPVPRILQRRVPHGALELAPGRVAKIERGHDGVGTFVIESAARVFDCGTREWIGLPEARSRIAALAARPARAGLLWNLEEAVPGTPPDLPIDLKALAFYGEVPVAYEVRRRAEKALNWYFADGTPFASGVEDGKTFPGGIPPRDRELDIARRISLAIPAPFVRIDFLRSAEGPLVFCEFTPRPGMFSRFNPPTNRLFGAAWQRAEARLLADLLAGRRFPEWEAARAAATRRDGGGD